MGEERGSTGERLGRFAPDTGTSSCGGPETQARPRWASPGHIQPLSVAQICWVSPCVS